MARLRRAVIARRYLRGHLRRYAFLAVAVGFGFAVITALSSLADGMEDGVMNAARSHYGGDLFILGYDAKRKTVERINDDNLVIRAVREAGLSGNKSVRRTNYLGKGMLYFAGTAARMKNVYGIDWVEESGVLNSLDWTERTFIDMSSLEREDMVVSARVADRIGARIGDDVVLKATTITGQMNTSTYILRGIFQDDSIFGAYKAYVDRRSLNKLIGFDPGDYSSLGITVDGRGRSREYGELLHAALDRIALTAPLIRDKDDFGKQRAGTWEGIKYYVLPLDVYVSQVDELLRAMEITSYGVFILVLLIVLVSIAVTFNLVIHERTREIATMRALGWPDRDIRTVLLLETFYLYAISMILGAAAAGIVLLVISAIPFTGIPGFEIFMKGGRLTGTWRLSTVAFNVALMLAIIVPAAWLPMNRVIRSPLAPSLTP